MTASPPGGAPPPPNPTSVTSPRRTSGAAVTSLVLGLLGLLGGWILFGLPCLLAIIFGHVGAAKTRSGEVAGHGVAVAGLVLGYVLFVPTVIATLLVLSPGFRDGLGDFFGGLV